MTKQETETRKEEEEERVKLFLHRVFEKPTFPPRHFKLKNDPPGHTVRTSTTIYYNTFLVQYHPAMYSYSQPAVHVKLLFHLTNDD